MEQFHKSPATYTIHLGNLTACLPEYMRHRRSITIFMCAQKGHNIIFKNQTEKNGECFGAGGMKFPAFCLPSIDGSRFCLHHSLTPFVWLKFSQLFPQILAAPGSWGCHNPKEFYKSRGGNDLSVAASREPTRTSGGVLPSKLLQKEPRWDPWPFPALLHPTACSGKASAQPDSKIRNLLQGHSYSYTKAVLSEMGGGKRELWVQRVLSLSEGFPQHTGNAQTRSGSCEG